ncbi:MAG: BMP family ABC transporter substrate-binding protein [Spirochaetales bacterium]|jgi:riboflavin transport system substrate-binding protein|nr:BMP family ABC transporter substrate-binding protein [Spirochaetales bacterium]
MKKAVKLFLVMGLLACLAGPAMLFAGPGAESTETGSFDIGIFVPGVVAGSPLYEQLVSGAERAAADAGNATVKVLEGGFNQGEWEEKLMSLAATMEYELILTSNGAMPFVAMPVAEAFPDQKFLIVDAIFEGHPQMHTLLYNQFEQGAMGGFLGALVSTSAMDGANPALKIGLIAGQEYPAMNDMIVPGYEYGAKQVNKGFEVDFRVLGNWYDANKAGELANSMFDAGVDVILTACGGANQGVITAAQDRGKYVLYFDDENYGLAPGTIVGCSVLMQDRAVYEQVTAAIAGDVEWGAAEIVDVAGGYVGFVDDHPLYVDAVSKEVRDMMAGVLADVRAGKIALEVPKFW